MFIVSLPYLHACRAHKDILEILDYWEDLAQSCVFIRYMPCKYCVCLFLCFQGTAGPYGPTGQPGPEGRRVGKALTLV